MKETDKQNQHQGNYTYIVKCSDETLYTGWTNNLKKRLEAHNSGKGAKYTKNRRPVELVYFEEYDTKQEAMKREYAIKQLSRQKKLALIRSHQSIFLKMFWEIAVNEAGFF
ncbi:MAG: GIY-YIG nuclease family protein [Anaerobutyricum hallii]